jgi:adenosylhomocysteine nucleosidase
VARIGAVVGLATEARIARRAGWTVAIGGGTASGATAAATALIEQGCTALISFGLAGGLDRALRPGAIVIPSMVIAGGERYATDPHLSRMLSGAIPDAAVPPHLLLGADMVVAGASEKQRLYRETGAAAVDLESGAVARAAATRGLPFAVLRAICDPGERTLPPAALVALDSQGAIVVWRVFGSLAAHPGQLPALLALASDAATAKRALAAQVSRISPAPAWTHAASTSTR